MAIMKKRYDDNDLIFTFKHCQIEALVDEEEVEPEEAQAIVEAVKSLSKEVCIDKSYVSFDENKHEKTFIKHAGWKDICKTVLKTQFGNKCTDQQHNFLLEAYKILIIAYMYQVLVDLGYDVENVALFMRQNSRFMVEIELDTTHAWRDYPGKWQSWDDDFRKKCRL